MLIWLIWKDWIEERRLRKWLKMKGKHDKTLGKVVNLEQKGKILTGKLQINQEGIKILTKLGIME